MASIVTRGNGTREIRVFVGGVRRIIRLGAVTMKDARDALSPIENLAACKRTGASPRNTTAEWIAGVDPVIRRRVEKAGLIGRQERVDVPTLGAWIDKYLALRKDVKSGTLTNFQQVRDLLLEHFPADKPLDQITGGDAEDFGLWLRTERDAKTEARAKHRKRKLAEGTTRRHLKRCKQFFAAAVKRGILQKNPFDGIKTSNYSADRYHFVSKEDAAAIFEACPDTEWRLLFALARYGGLRVPSEILPLTWGDVNWEKSCFVVHSPKTEGYDGKGTRIVPIFPELLPYLREAFEAAEPGSVHLITRYRHSNVNLRTQLLRIIKRAGLKPWPKLFQNLRSTRQTELEDSFPSHVVCRWLGNSPAVARKHYLQVTDAHFAKAIGGIGKSTPESTPEVHHNAHQRAAAEECGEMRDLPEGERNPEELGELCTSAQSGAGADNSTHVANGDPKGI